MIHLYLEDRHLDHRSLSVRGLHYFGHQSGVITLVLTAGVLLHSVNDKWKGTLLIIRLRRLFFSTRLVCIMPVIYEMAVYLNEFVKKPKHQPLKSTLHLSIVG